MYVRNYIDALERIEYCIADQAVFSQPLVYGLMGALFLLGLLANSQYVVAAMLSLYILHGVYLMRSAQLLYDSLDLYQELLGGGKATSTYVPLWYGLVWGWVSSKHYKTLSDRAAELKACAVDKEILG